MAEPPNWLQFPKSSDILDFFVDGGIYPMYRMGNMGGMDKLSSIGMVKDG